MSGAPEHPPGLEPEHPPDLEPEVTEAQAPWLRWGVRYAFFWAAVVLLLMVADGFLHWTVASAFTGLLAFAWLRRS